MPKEIRPVYITHLPLDKDREEVFAIVKRSRMLINSICQYSKDLRKKGVEVYERRVNIIRTNAGYFCAFFEDDINDNTTNKKEPIEPFEGIDGRMKVKLTKDGEVYVEDLAKMVALMFVPNPDKFEFVKHKDGDLKNNKQENLYWSKEK